MHDIQHEIERLRARAGHGDASARRDFERRFANPLRRIVRRVLKLNRAETPFERGIIREAERQRLAAADGQADGEQLVMLLTRRICEAVFARSGARPETLFATMRVAWPVDTEAV